MVEVKMWGKIFFVMFALLFILVGCDGGESTKEQEIEKRREQTEEVDKAEKSESFSENKDDTKSDKDFELEQELEQESEYYFDEDLGGDLAEFEYLNKIQNVIKAFAIAIENNKAHVDKAAENPLLLQSEAWINDLALTYQPISFLAYYMQTMEEDGDVPDSMLGIHTELKEAIISMDEAGKILVEAIRDDMDDEKYNKGIELVKKSINTMNEVSEIVDEKISIYNR